MVVPLDETTVVPNGMPVPEMDCPATTPVRLDTDVTDVLPAVTMPVGEIVLLAVAAFDITIVVPLDETTVVPVGMPVPERTWPFITEVRLDTPVMDVLPEVTMPVTVPVLVAVAAFEITMVEVAGVNETTVVEDGMPVPVMVWPVTTPVKLDTDVMFRLPEVTTPVGVTVLFAVALDGVIVIVLAVNDAMVDPVGCRFP